MRNILNTYRLCKNIENNMEVHKCKKIAACDAYGEAGTMRFVDARRINKKLKANQVKNLAKERTNWLRFHTFAEERGYIKTYWCSDVETVFATIGDKGIVLTDNLLLPYTPVGLWKAMWVEHKVVIGLLYSLVVSIVTGGIFSIIKLISELF